VFTEQQIVELGQPLEQERVKYRRQAGRQISYLEGYDVIDRANAIFGFDGWSYAVLDTAFVRMGEVAFYQATVRVWIGNAERTDVGVGDVAFPRDRGLDGANADAYGTALKGAVTDGLKRALRTFGGQFGNSLYDKDDPSNTLAMESHDTFNADKRGTNGVSGSARLVQETDDSPACAGCGGTMALRSGTTRDGRPYTAWFCDAKCGQKPVWVNDRKAS
jgi:DNA recombination protein Rad52